MLMILDGLIENSANTRLWTPLFEALADEVERIHTCLIASLIHPNRAGAAQYARMVVERYKSHRRSATRAHLERLNGAASSSIEMSVRSTLRRFGLKPEAGLRGCLQQMIVDSLAGLIKTKKGNLSVLGPELADPLFLDFGAESVGC
jgi:hypothetical protein